MEENHVEPQDTPIAKPTKNPWWVKTVPIVFVICDLVKIAYLGEDIMDIICVPLFIWSGIIIHKDKIILSKIIRILFVINAIVLIIFSCCTICGIDIP